MSLDAVRQDLRRHASDDDATFLQRFFKTGPGEYAEGDVFIGVRVPRTRQVARAHRSLPVDDVLTLLRSEIHEERLLALVLLVHRYEKGTAEEKERIYRQYLAHTRHINNWDLVDASADKIVGAHLFERDRKPLYALVASADLWERRIAIIATFHFIRRHDFADTLALAEKLLGDGHDLIHKAVGWMLREVGKRDEAALDAFLDTHLPRMPRTALRYAIERMPEAKRLKYLRAGR